MLDLYTIKRKLFHKKPDLRIRLATNADVFEIMSLIKETREDHGLGLDLKKRDQDLLNISHYYKHGLFLVAEDNGKIVACASMYKDSSSVTHLSKLVVSKYYRRMGLGTELLSMLVLEAKDKGSSHILTSLFPQMKLGRKFLRHSGFESISAVMPEGKNQFKKYILDFRH